MAVKVENCIEQYVVKVDNCIEQCGCQDGQLTNCIKCTNENIIDQHPRVSLADYKIGLYFISEK
jgi:hypothetical protein